MSLPMLHGVDFDFLSEEKGKLAHIINETCKKESIEGKWLVIEETVASILIEVRYLERLEREYLLQRVFSYVDSQPRAGQRVRYLGVRNEILRIEVKWSLPDYVLPEGPAVEIREDRKEPDHHLDVHGGLD